MQKQTADDFFEALKNKSKGSDMLEMLEKLDRKPPVKNKNESKGNSVPKSKRVT